MRGNWPGKGTVCRGDKWQWRRKVMEANGFDDKSQVWVEKIRTAEFGM